MGNTSIGGFKVGDAIGPGQIIHPSQKGSHSFEKRVTVDVNRNGKADKGDQVVLVAYKKPLDRGILPAFQEMSADNKVARKFQRLDKTQEVGGTIALGGVCAGLLGLGFQSGIVLGAGAVGVVVGGAMFIGAGIAGNVKENRMVKQHLDSVIPNFVTAKP
jgi:hypothetical protein